MKFQFLQINSVVYICFMCKYASHSHLKVFKWKKLHWNDPVGLFRLELVKLVRGCWKKMRLRKMEATDYFMVCGCNGAVKWVHNRPHQSTGSQYAGLGGGIWRGWRGLGVQMTSHMEEPRRNAAHVGKILISACDYSCMKVRIINNSGGLCTISHSSKEEGSRSNEQFNVGSSRKCFRGFQLSLVPSAGEMCPMKMWNANKTQILL